MNSTPRLINVPYVIEGQSPQERVYDLASRLLKDRIIFFGSKLNPDVANSIIAQMLFLEADDPERDIIMYINSPGGSVTDCMGIYDTLKYIKPDVSTICMGQACSAAAFLLAAGTKGKRYALKNSRIMIHQVSAGSSGTVKDMEIHFKEANFLNNLLAKELAELTGHTVNKILKDIDRDHFMSAVEAKKYGIIDDVLDKRSI